MIDVFRVSLITIHVDNTVLLREGTLFKKLSPGVKDGDNVLVNPRLSGLVVVLLALLFAPRNGEMSMGANAY